MRFGIVSLPWSSSELSSVFRVQILGSTKGLKKGFIRVWGFQSSEVYARTVTEGKRLAELEQESRKTRMALLPRKTRHPEYKGTTIGFSCPCCLHQADDTFAEATGMQGCPKRIP